MPVGTDNPRYPRGSGAIQRQPWAAEYEICARQTSSSSGQPWRKIIGDPFAGPASSHNVTRADRLTRPERWSAHASISNRVCAISRQSSSAALRIGSAWAR